MSDKRTYNSTKFKKRKKSKDYKKVQLPVHLPRDKRLYPIDIGLMYYLLSLPNSWTIRKKNVIEEFKSRGVSENSLIKSWKRLSDLGYIRIYRDKNFQGVTWVISEQSWDN